jgi:hypothetical protein
LKEVPGVAAPVAPTTRGDRRLRYVAGEVEARKLVRKTLRRRATANKRIRVLYRFRKLIDPWTWLSPTPQESIPRRARAAAALRSLQ